MTEDLSTPDSDTTLVTLSNALRHKLNTMAEKLFIVGNRCVHSSTGRELRPHQRLLLEAAWEVAQRYPQEFSMAVMRRTEPRAEFGIRADHLATGHRPR